MSQGTGSDVPLSALQGAGGVGKKYAVLVQSGLLSGGLPHRTAKRLSYLAKYGPTLAGAWAAGYARSPNKTAVIDEQRQLTYAELDHRVRRISAGLVAQGITPAGGGVAMYQRNSVYALETLVSSSRAGLNCLLLNTFLSAPQVTEILHRERPSAVIVDAELRSNLTDVPEGTKIIIAAPDGGATGELSLDDLAKSTEPDLKPPKRPGRVIILTSGTTGTPKGAKRGAPKGLGAPASMLSRLKFKAPETMMIAPPLFHTWGLGMAQLAPALDSTVVLRRRPDPETILDAVAAHRCTSLVVVPVMLQRLVDLPEEVRGKYDTSALRVVACSSAAIPPDVCTRFQDAFGDVLYNIYGSTEVSWAAIANPEDLRKSPGTVGKPPWATKLALLDENNRPVPRGQIGRIFVGNEMQFDGYTNGNDRERALGGLMATGDRGVLDENNLLMVLGRDDDMVIVGGENVYPVEVEDLLIERPEIKEVAVVGVADQSLGQRLAAYVVLHDGASLTADRVREIVAGRLAKFSVPRDVVFLDALPRNATGKVVPRLLPAPAG
jgi:acyl-CoA synthetase (AMP-forming)/AMP-acid ligase II